MARFTFLGSVLLASIGMALGLYGVLDSDFRTFMCGFVLLAGAGVFALLHIGLCRSLVEPVQSPPQ